MHLRPHFAPPLAVDPAARTVTAVISSARCRIGPATWSIPPVCGMSRNFCSTPLFSGRTSGRCRRSAPACPWTFSRTDSWPSPNLPRACRSPRTCFAFTSKASSVGGRSDFCRIGAAPADQERPRRADRRVGPARILGRTVPENPQALTLAVEKGLIHDRCLRDWLRRWCVDPFAELVA